MRNPLKLTTTMSRWLLDMYLDTYKKYIQKSRQVNNIWLSKAFEAALGGVDNLMAIIELSQL